MPFFELSEIDELKITFMKQCPSCRTTYTDETLRFCLADGSTLNSINEEQATRIRQVVVPVATVVMGTKAPTLVENQSATTNSTTGSSTSFIFKAVMVVIGLGILALLLLGAVGAIVYFSTGKGEPPIPNSANAKQTQSTPTPAKDERDDMRDQIANLQKQLNEQKKASQPANMPLTMPKQSATTTTASANSPGDGFLALRSLPNSELGERIVKIPHGATVNVGACGPIIKPVARSGRWCQATYNGYTGWVFDAYLTY